jgi:hypothetical protein
MLNNGKLSALKANQIIVNICFPWCPSSGQSRKIVEKNTYDRFQTAPPYWKNACYLRISFYPIKKNNRLFTDYANRNYNCVPNIVI